MGKKKNGNSGTDKPKDQSGTTSGGPGFTTGKTHKLSEGGKTKKTTKKTGGKSGGKKSGK